MASGVCLSSPPNGSSNHAHPHSHLMPSPPRPSLFRPPLAVVCISNFPPPLGSPLTNILLHRVPTGSACLLPPFFFLFARPPGPALSASPVVHFPWRRQPMTFLFDHLANINLDPSGPLRRSSSPFPPALSLPTHGRAAHARAKGRKNARCRPPPVNPLGDDRREARAVRLQHDLHTTRPVRTGRMQPWWWWWGGVEGDRGGP